MNFDKLVEIVRKNPGKDAIALKGKGEPNTKESEMLTGTLHGYCYRRPAPVRNPRVEAYKQYRRDVLSRKALRRTKPVEDRMQAAFNIRLMRREFFASF